MYHNLSGPTNKKTTHFLCVSSLTEAYFAFYQDYIQSVSLNLTKIHFTNALDLSKVL